MITNVGILSGSPLLSAITDGAIYKVDNSGNETMVSMWNHCHLEKVK